MARPDLTDFVLEESKGFITILQDLEQELILEGKKAELDFTFDPDKLYTTVSYVFGENRDDSR